MKPDPGSKSMLDGIRAMSGVTGSRGFMLRRGARFVETKSPPPSKEDGGLRHSRIDGFLNWRAARGFDDERAAGDRTEGAPQGVKRQARRKELDSGRRLRPSRVGHAGKPRPRPSARNLLPFAGVVQDVERHGVAAGAVAQAFRHAGDGGCRRPRGLLDGSI